MNIFVFDIETVPDVQAGRKLHNLDNLSDEDVIAAMQAKRREASNGSDFQRHYCHQIVAISVVMRSSSGVKVWSLGDEQATEAELIERFFSGIEKYTPTIVSWNGSAFDLPVLHYRAMIHKIAAPQYWEMGDNDNQFRWNNYLNRYHFRHLDLMDIIACYQARAYAPLSDIAQLLGFPGKVGMSGDKVLTAYLNNELAAIRNYCETDVLNTYLVYLRFELMRGNLSHERYQEESDLLKDYLQQEAKPHFTEFLQHWQD